MPSHVYVEENGVYQIDCSAALWSTDRIHSVYHASAAFLCDADFVVETTEYLLLIEYKNANIPGAVNPSSFNPLAGNKVDNIARKFYDSLHYLTIEGKAKPIRYVYVVEYPNAGLTDRLLLRNAIAKKLPFAMQRGKPRRLIEDFEVLSIEEWNAHSDYAAFPFSKV